MEKKGVNEIIEIAIDLDQKILLELELLDLRLDRRTQENLDQISTTLRSVIDSTTENARLLNRIRTGLIEV